MLKSQMSVSLRGRWRWKRVSLRCGSRGDLGLWGLCEAQASVWRVCRQALGSHWSFHAGPMEITIYYVNPSVLSNVRSVKENKQGTRAATNRAHLWAELGIWLPVYKVWGTMLAGEQPWALSWPSDAPPQKPHFPPGSLSPQDFQFYSLCLPRL